MKRGRVTNNPVPFGLDPRLEGDTVPVTSLALSRVLLMNDTRFPWLILVPARDGVTEIHDLDASDRNRLMEEITLASRVLSELYAPDKINIGALGNIVNQLHVHVVGRSIGDAAWPGPVWGHGEPLPYAPDDLDATMDRLRAAFAGQ